MTQSTRVPDVCDRSRLITLQDAELCCLAGLEGAIEDIILSSQVAGTAGQTLYDHDSGDGWIASGERVLLAAGERHPEIILQFQPSLPEDRGVANFKVASFVYPGRHVIVAPNMPRIPPQPQPQVQRTAGWGVAVAIMLAIAIDLLQRRRGAVVDEPNQCCKCILASALQQGNKAIKVCRRGRIAR